MYYEEKLINGELYSRGTPDGPWEPVDSARAVVILLMVTLSEEQRREVMRFFCGDCGIVQPDGRACQCWNDE